MKAKNKLIVALDVDDLDRAVKLVDILSPEVDMFKVGITPFTDFGLPLLKKLGEREKKVFLDLKFHDIPNTVKNAARAAVRKNVFMMNFHCLGGRKMLEEAVKGASEEASRTGRRKPLLLGVTVLTSMNEEDMVQLGITGSVDNKVLEFGKMAKDAGLDGIVASAHEARKIKNQFGKDFLVVTPGIRPVWAASGDQKRVVTPGQAIENGSDFIVVGRPVIHADDPLEAAKKVIGEMGG